MPIMNQQQMETALGMLSQQVKTSDINPAALRRLESAIRIAGGAEDLPPRPPMQNCRQIYMPGLTAKPWHDPEQFPWISTLEGASEAIRRELLALLDSEEGFTLHTQHDHLIKEGRWTEYNLFFGGRKHEENCARCPETVKVIEKIATTGALGGIKFSLAAPHTHIEPHSGPNNLRLRCHLGLVVPEGCEIRVGNEIRRWQEGKCLVLDDSFDHEVWNRSDHYRAILLVDFWHPELTPFELAVIGRLKAFLDPS